MRSFPLLLVLSTLAFHVHAADVLSAEQAARDARILVKAMSTLHPALDKYRSPDDVGKAFSRFEARAGAARSATDMYLAATELAASVRCGHTWTNVLNQQGAIKTQLLDSPNKLPFTMTLVENRFLVLASATPALAAGDEVLAIDGVPVAGIVERMLPYLRADGSSDGKRLRQLSHDRPDYSMVDILWPLLSPPVNGSYRITIAERGELGVPATTLAARAANLAQQGVQPVSEAWRFRIDGKRAVMTVPTFSVYRNNFDWRGFFASAFDELARTKIPTLVIDIRSNEGGDGAIGIELLSYVVREPMTFTSDQSVTMYERVPYSLARYLDTWDFGFFDRTGNVRKIVDGPQAGRYSFLPNAAKVRQIEPKPSAFRGKVYLLVGAENSSATFALADLAKRARVATLVGQPTGGNQRGLNGGQLTWVTLPNSGVAVDIPLLASTYLDSTPDASVQPDILVVRTLSARKAGRDQEMAATGH